MRRGFMFMLFCLMSVFNIYADTHYANSPSYNDVVAAITASSSGDTVIVPAGSGSVLWPSHLTITEGIILQGPGQNALTITTNLDAYSGALIMYQPSNPSLNEIFQMTGFKIDAASYTSCLLINNTSNDPITKVRVHHNTFANGHPIGVKIYGPVYGVADHNDFIDVGTSAIHGGAATGDYTAVNGHDQDSYDYNGPSSYGDSLAFFFEDNTFRNASNRTGGVYFQNSNGARFVFRFNEAWNHNDQQIYDIHGNNHNPVVPGYTQARAPLNAEVYGNVIHSTREGSSHNWFALRGGSLLMYDNTIDGLNAENSYFGLQEEDATNDKIIPAICSHNQTSYICSKDHVASADNEPGVGPNWQLHWSTTTVVPYVYIIWEAGINFLYSESYDPISDTYFYNNKDHSNTASIYISDSKAVPYIQENVNYWMQDPRGKTIKGKVYQPYAYPHPLRGETQARSSRARLRAN